MQPRVLTEFLARPAEPEEIEHLHSGQGLFLPAEVWAEISELTAAPDAEAATAGVLALKACMPAGDLFHTALTAMLCGVLVERGASPEAAIEETLELFLRQLDALIQNPDEATVAAGSLTFMATMTMLCRSTETRKRWRGRPDVLSRLDELEDEDLAPQFLRPVFTLHDDRDLIVLDPENKRGFLFRMVGVRDVLYHCYALLQDALLRHAGPGYLGAEPVDPEAVRYAQNRDIDRAAYAARSSRQDSQRFNFTFPGGPAFMPGSASPDGLPTLDGALVLVVERRGAQFGWDPANMYPIVHEALKSSVELVEEFDGERVQALLARF